MLVCVSLNVAQLTSHLELPPKALWADDEARRRMVTCATIWTGDAEGRRSRAGEVVILEPSAVTETGLLSALDSLPLQELAAIFLPARGLTPADRKHLGSTASEHSVAIGILDDGTDIRALANSLNRSLLPAQMDIAHLRVRGANTLQEAADTLARLVGDSVTIETPQDQLLVFSALKQQVDRVREETILYRHGNRQIRRWLDREGYTARLFESDEPLRIPPNEDLNFPGRLALRVAFDGEVLGVIWLADVNAKLTETNGEILTEAAEVVATILLRERTVVQRDAELRAEFVEDIIRGRIANPEYVRSVARSLGWNIDRLQQALAVVVDDVESFRRNQINQSGRRSFPLRERLTELIRLEALAVDPDAFVASQRDGALILLDPGAQDLASRKGGALALGESIVKRIGDQDMGSTVTVGVGRDFPSLDGLTESYRQAVTAASVGSSRLGGSQALHFDELGIHRILHVLQTHDNQPPDALAALVDYDRRHNTDLVKTLKVYFETMGRPSAASQILHLHRNSLDYRIKRIQEIAGTSLEHPDTRLVLELGIRLLELEASER